jgi:hypothetical protein
MGVREYLLSGPLDGGARRLLARLAYAGACFTGRSTSDRSRVRRDCVPKEECSIPPG